MHIKTGNSHLVSQSNLFRYASRQVVLMENWKSYNFMEDIHTLFSKRMLPWDNIYRMYYRESEELKKPHIVIFSAIPLNADKELKDYSILLDA